MSTRNSSKSSLFLIELIIAILFFAIASAVCVRAFVKAHSLSTEAKDLSFASAEVSSMASVLKYTGRSLDEIHVYYPEAEETADGFLVFYDGARNLCGREDACYQMRASLSESSGMMTASLRLERENADPIYELELRFVPSEEGKEGAADAD